MPPRIDPARREIAVGTRRLPFRLDLRNDRVSVTLGGAEAAVRPLQWREKVTLARFADLGPEFLRDEVIRLCTVSELPSPLEPEDAEVLWELAAWMSESPASLPVPLDSRSLATVTLRLCRAMGLKPADFDSRSAPEVEALWEALGQQQAEAVAAEDSASESSSSSSSSSTTRIVIVPDEEPRIAAGSAAVREESRFPGGEAGDSSGRDARSAAGETPAVRQEDAPQQTQARVVASQSIGAVAMVTAQNAATTSAMPVPAAPPTQVPRSTLGMRSRETVIPSIARDLGGRGTMHGQGWEARPTPAPPHVQVPRPSRVTTTGTASVAATPATPAIQPVSGTLALVPESTLPFVTVEDRESPAPLDFFEELADRLEQAAAEMGLGED